MKDYIPESLKRIFKIQKQIESQIPIIKELEKINKIVEKQKLLTSSFSKLPIPAGLQKTLEQHARIETSLRKLRFPKYDIPAFNNLHLLKIPDSIRKIAETIRKLNEHPELQFSSLTDFELLNISTTEELKKTLTSDLEEEDIEEKEELLNKNLIPALKQLDLENLWNGANHVFCDRTNPDRLRHCLISLRTILEYLIDYKLAPKTELKDSELFKSEFKKYHSGKKELNEIKNLSRKKKIKYFTSKIDFYRIDFTINDIEFICECYTVLCNIHEPEIGISENQVRSLKVKTGITIWFLLHIYTLISNKEDSLK